MKSFQLIMNVSNSSRDLALLRGGITGATKLTRAIFSEVCLTGFQFVF